jgi:hypothetical protein
MSLTRDSSPYTHTNTTTTTTTTTIWPETRFAGLYGSIVVLSL